MSRRRKGSKEGRVEEDSQEKGSKKSNNLEKCCIAVSDNKKKTLGLIQGCTIVFEKLKVGFQRITVVIIWCVLRLRVSSVCTF